MLHCIQKRSHDASKVWQSEDYITQTTSNITNTRVCVVSPYYLAWLVVVCFPNAIKSLRLPSHRKAMKSSIEICLLQVRIEGTIIRRHSFKIGLKCWLTPPSRVSVRSSSLINRISRVQLAHAERTMTGRRANENGKNKMCPRLVVIFVYYM